MKSILVFRTAALGDFVLGAPALAEVRKQYPGRHIVLLTSPSVHSQQRDKVAGYTGSVDGVPWVALAMPHLVDECLVLGKVGGFRSLFALRRRLKAYDFEVAILMVDVASPVFRRAAKLLFLLLLLGPIRILGWRGPLTWKAEGRGIKKRGQLRHHVHGPLQFLSEMNPPKTFREEDLVFDLRPGAEARGWAESWLSGRNWTGRLLVAAAPGSIQPHKHWPESSFRELFLKLLERHPEISIVILGTEGDRELGDRLGAVNPQRILNLAGGTTILQSAALLKHCRLLVGNDGGAVHLGDAMGCKVVSIVPGIEYPDSIEPWHNKSLAVRHPVPCAPCYCFTHCPLGHNRCITELPVDQVYKKCDEALAA